MRGPSRWILKQTNGPDATIGAEIEPVQRASRYTDQITGFDFDAEHGSRFTMNMKDPMPRDDKSHFVFVVPVLAIELRQQRVETRRCRGDVDHISSHVATTSFELLDLARVCVE